MISATMSEIKLLYLFLCAITPTPSQSTYTVSVCIVSTDVTYHGLFIDCHDKGLAEIPRDFPANTTSIDLSHNLIDALTNDSFKTVDRLRFLNLENNHISQLEHQVFMHNTALETLKLKANGGSLCYDGSIFDELVNLKSLSIDSCYSGRIFHNLEKLQHIEINSNGPLNCTEFHYLRQLKYFEISGFVELPNQTFNDLTDLKIEKLCVHARINLLEEDVFAPLKYITELSMVNTYRGLKGTLSALHGLTGRNMTTLEMNGISYDAKFQTLNDTDELIITQDSMKYLLRMCVRRLVLSNNDILYIDQLAIERSLLGRCLTYLDVSRNRLRHFTFEVIFHLPLLSSLKYLDISQQDRTTPRPRIYSGCFFQERDLKNLTWYGMPFTSHENGYIIRVPPVLEIINISGFTAIFGNLINKISFQNGQNILKIDVSYNGIAYLSPVEGLDNLEYADLSGNVYLRMPNTFFDPFSYLETLKLNDESLPQSIVNYQGRRFLKSLPRLKSLHISGNRLIELPQNLFDFSPDLQYLDLSRNIFSSIPFDLLLTPNLRILDMTFNSLGSLDSPTRRNIDTQYENTNRSFHLSLYGNFFSCSCGNFQFLFWFKETNTYNEKSRNLSCLTQTGKIKYTSQINENFIQFWRQCTGEKIFSISAVLLTLLLCSILLALLIATNMTKIANLLINTLRHQVPKPRREDFIRDVYVSYADADYQWVCHELCPALEERNLSLYIWDRDSVPGDSIPDLIAENITQCWKIILYFTANYETDPWSYFSMMVAINCVDNLNPERLLLLLPEDERPRIPDCLLEVVPESCIIHIPAGVRRNDPLWDEISGLVKNK